MDSSQLHSQKTDQKRPIKRMRSPSRFTRPFTRGRYFRPRFYYRNRDDRFSRRPGFGLRFQRFNRASFLRLSSRSRSPTLVLKRKVELSSSPSFSQHSDKRPEKKSTSTTVREHKSNTPDHSRSSSVASERPVMSFTVTQEGQMCSGREAPSSVTRAAARTRAIQKKREEIEEVYRRDCDTFGVVVKMLVAKDPSLERPIQLSLRENLREIGLRCVEAMEQFIQEYDSREPGTLPPLQPH
ncbi:periphilin-1-like [Pygocentrus nattereri]|uniref:Periphilin-1 C-terminal domain-containing protein n=1 Tax=Pygocentrus nattereri TaxID=42514 RepID=A0AAR2M0E3_PYGNA|nr:periphilin-1-like [Pygocentrus nattereri]